MPLSARLALLAAILSIASVAIHSGDAIAQDAGVPDDAAPPEIARPVDPPLGHPLPEGLAPIVWAAQHGRDCHRYLGRRVCEGPRRVPVARPEAVARAQALGLEPAARVSQIAMYRVPLPEWVAAAPPLARQDDLLWPVVGGRLWRTFGIQHRLGVTQTGELRQLRATRQHEGVDIGAHAGTLIRAVNDALVVYSDNRMRGYGNAVILVHSDSTVTMYAHCRAVYVAAGEIVRRGQTIAEVGDTGLAHGAHLHFEWRVEGRVHDPLPHFAERPERPGHEDEELVAPTETPEPSEPLAQAGAEAGG